MEYKSLKTRSSAELIEKRSRFIGYAAPVSSEAEALAFIGEISKKHWDASHNVYAYLLREGGARYSDNGEPQGTAGLPVLSVLQKGGLTDACLVVTRYFGGTLLGASGLVRAYSRAAALAVEAAGVITSRLCAVGRVMCDYSSYNRAAAIIPDCGGTVGDAEFTDRIAISFRIPPGRLDDLTMRLADATNGTAVITITGEGYFMIEPEE